MDPPFHVKLLSAKLDIAKSGWMSLAPIPNGANSLLLAL
jgi:hypothetical protein